MQRIWLSFVLLTLCTLIASAEEPNKVEKTTGKSKEWMENFLNEQLVEMTVYKMEESSRAAVFIRSKGRLQKDVIVWKDEMHGNIHVPDSSSIFVLYDNEPCRIADHHGSMTFQVSKIKENSVIFFYRSTFDHNSFGKRLTTIDEGEVEIKLRKPSN